MFVNQRYSIQPLQAGDTRNALLDAIRRSSKAVLKPASEVRSFIIYIINLKAFPQRSAPSSGEKKKGNGGWDALKDKLMVTVTLVRTVA